MVIRNNMVNNMSSLHCLKCEVCGGEYGSKAEWHSHLTGEKHQLLARRGCLEVWGEGERECCLVVYSTFPLGGGSGGGDRIIEYLGKEPGTFVTDIVWWGDRDRIGILQFESGKKAREILKLSWSSGSLTQILIDGDKVEVKWGMDLGEVEWSAILPSGSGGDAHVPPTIAPPTVPVITSPLISHQSHNEAESRQVSSTPKQTRKITSESSTSSSPSLRKRPLVSSSTPPLQPVSSKKPKTGDSDLPPNKNASSKIQESQIKAPSTFHLQPIPISPSTSYPDSLRHQFWNLCRSIRIPDHDHTATLQLISALRTLFLLHDPSANVSLFRNHFLQLKGPDTASNSELLIFAYNSTQPPDHPQSFTWIREAVVRKIFSSPTAVKNFTILESLEDSSRYDPTNHQVGWKVKCNPSGLTFRLIFFKRFIAEVQMCRMVEYLITFDTRCHPLMTLAYHWAAVNHVRFGVNNPSKKNTHQNVPEPISLQWLVISFLIRRGFLPTPREIQTRPHAILRDRLTQIDVGFNPDPEFSKDWKSKTDPSKFPPGSEEFILEVVTIFQEFLEFYGGLVDGGNWILNTRDGELISTDKLLSCDPDLKTKMTLDEVESLKALQLEDKTNVKITDAYLADAVKKAVNFRMDFKEWKLYMVHPFVVTWKISTSKYIRSALSLMKISGGKLKRYLEMRRGQNGVEVARKRFGRLDKVLTVDVPTRIRVCSIFELGNELQRKK